MKGYPLVMLVFIVILPTLHLNGLSLFGQGWKFNDWLICWKINKIDADI